MAKKKTRTMTRAPSAADATPLGGARRILDAAAAVKKATPRKPKKK